MTGPRFMIYGANGYTGKLIAREAKQRSLSPVLAGRNAAKVAALAAELDFEHRSFALDADVAAQLQGVQLVLHCAGPFSATCEPMIRGCAEAGVDYADITGEIDSCEYIHHRSERWEEAGIVALPGAGSDVVPTDCIAAMLKRDLPDATHLKLAFLWPERISPGTMKSSIEGAPGGGRMRRDGQVVAVEEGYRVEAIPFLDKPRKAVTIPWGDVSTAYHSTGIPNIEVYAAMPEARIRLVQGPMRKLLGLSPVQKLAKGLASLSRGPGEAYRQRTRSQVWGQARNARGAIRTKAGTGPEVYDLTVRAALAVVERMLAGGLAPGATTPSLAFGPEFARELPGMEIRDLD
jgi:saccharopine dehydrogenase (NAD+, L-lysine-forming)